MNSKGTAMTPPETIREECEREPCLPNNARKSMEDLNRTRDQMEDQQNSSVLASEKNERKNSYNVKQTKPGSRFGMRFTAPPETRFEKWAREKTGYTRFGLIVQGVLVFLLLVFAITVLLMACLWPNIPHSFSYPVCRTPQCLLASSEIVSRMNQSVSPCQDFREASCGYWLRTHPLPKDKSIWGTKQLMQFKHREKIRDLISTTMAAHTYDVEKIQWKIKNLYDSCMSHGSVETEAGRPLKKVITMLGGWKVLRDFSLESWDMKRTLRMLHSEYNVQPFFHVELVSDPVHPLQSVIRISPGSLGLPNKNYYFRGSDDKIVIAYKRYLKDVAMNLGATSSDASTFAEDIYGFEKRLAERFPSSWSQPSPAPNYSTTIARLQQIAPSVPFYDILTATFPNSKLNMQSQVMVVASDHLVNVSRIISATDRSVLNDYLMWKLATAYLPYLSKSFRNTVHEFHRHLYGNKIASPRWEFCVQVVQKFIGLGLETILESQHSHDMEAKKKVAVEIFEEIREAMKRTIESSKNLPPHVQEHFLDKMDKLGIEVGPPVPMWQPFYYNEQYRSLTTMKDDFFKNVLHGVSFLIENQEKKFKEPSEEHRWLDLLADGQLKIRYVPEINKVIIPLSILAMPYFNPQYPPPVLYGGIGVEIGLAVVNAVTGRGLFYSGDGEVLTRDHPVSNFSHDCFLHHPSPVPQLEAVRITFEALNRVLSLRPHWHQPALEYYEDQAVFFLAYAQSICEMRTPEQLDIDQTLKITVDDTTILESIGTKMKEFKSTFSCRNPLVKDACSALI